VNYLRRSELDEPADTSWVSCLDSSGQNLIWRIEGELHNAGPTIRLCMSGGHRNLRLYRRLTLNAHVASNSCTVELNVLKFNVFLSDLPERKPCAGMRRMEAADPWNNRRSSLSPLWQRQRSGSKQIVGHVLQMTCVYKHASMLA
jgi:hypothetical protein